MHDKKIKYTSKIPSFFFFKIYPFSKSTFLVVRIPLSFNLRSHQKSITNFDIYFWRISPFSFLWVSSFHFHHRSYLGRWLFRVICYCRKFGEQRRILYRPGLLCSIDSTWYSCLLGAFNFTQFILRCLESRFVFHLRGLQSLGP